MFDGHDDQHAKPCAEELYELATNASNLRQEADRRGAADVLRDMAMSTDRLGAALRRLRSQWERVEKPMRPRTRSAKEWAEILPRVQQGVRKVRNASGKEVEEPIMVLDMASAELANQEERDRHDAAYTRELARLASQLPELPAVRDAVTIQAVKWGIEHAAEKASAVVRYWLDQNCPACDGTKWETVAGTNRQSTKVCKCCRGSGVAPVPHGQEGRKLANHMDQCLHRHRQTLKARRKAFQSIPAIDRLSKRAQPGGPDPEAD